MWRKTKGETRRKRRNERKLTRGGGSARQKFKKKAGIKCREDGEKKQEE